MTIVLSSFSLFPTSCYKANNEIPFTVGFDKTILGNDYFIESCIVKSASQLKSVISTFQFREVEQKYNEAFLSSKSIVIFSFNISGGNQLELQNIQLINEELVIEYIINSYPGTASLYSKIMFIEVDREIVEDITSVKGKL